MKSKAAEDPASVKRLEKDLAAIIRTLPAESRPRAVEVIASFFKGLRPTVH
jgi:hypothetical protein